MMTNRDRFNSILALTAAALGVALLMCVLKKSAPLPTGVTNVNQGTPDRREDILIVNEGGAVADLTAPWKTYNDPLGVSIDYPAYMSVSTYTGGQYVQRYSGDQAQAYITFGFGGPYSEAEKQRAKELFGPSVSTNMSFQIFLYKKIYAPQALIGQYLNGLTFEERNKYPIQTISRKTIAVPEGVAEWTYEFLWSRSNYERQHVMEFAWIPKGGWSAYARTENYVLPASGNLSDSEIYDIMLRVIQSLKIDE